MFHIAGPVRNRRYLSLRVKLLKRQFGLPGDVLSLKSLSLASPPSVSNSAAAGGNHPASAASVARQDAENRGGGSRDRFSYGGVHHVSDAHTSAVTRMLFAQAPSTPSSEDGSGGVVGGGDLLVCASADGSISVSDLSRPADPSATSVLSAGGVGSSVLDLDLSQSGELAATCSTEGAVSLWDLPRRRVLRTISSFSAGTHPVFCRFVPQNNNLVVCSDSGGATRVFNVSTGKADASAGCCPLIGRSLCAEMGQRGEVLWVGNDRGHVESLRLTCGGGQGSARLLKGCRMTVGGGAGGRGGGGVTCLSYRAAPRSSDKPSLLASHGSSSLRLFSVLDDFGTLEPLADLSTGDRSPLMSCRFAPLLCAGGLTSASASSTCAAAAGAEDGSVLLLDLEKGRQQPSGAGAGSSVANKLLGHCKPVIAVAFSSREDFLATADTSGQVIVWKR